MMPIVKGTAGKVEELASAEESAAVQATFEELTDAKTQGAAEQAVATMQTPPGSKWVYNRLNQPFEKFFDGIPYKFQAHAKMVLPDAVAEFMWRTSVVSYEPASGLAVRALVVPEDTDFGVPYVAALGPELMSRAVEDNYIQRGTGGIPTKAKIVPVRGGGYDSGRQVSTESRI
jgi:hypothetical protein